MIRPVAVMAPALVSSMGIWGCQRSEACKTWYAEVGFPDEWRLHHQGGAIGYDNREYKIGPATDVKVQERQAFTWNPTITGAQDLKIP